MVKTKTEDANFLIILLSKTPKGRIGPEKFQDWYKTVLKAKKISERYGNAEVIVPTNMQARGYAHEADMYEAACKEIGISRFQIIRQGYETIEQITIARSLAKEKNANLIFISALPHYPRIRLLTTGMHAKHVSAGGLPSADIVLEPFILAATFVASLAGLKKQLQEFIIKQRKKGIQY